jgi:hypothetical protein
MTDEKELMALAVKSGMVVERWNTNPPRFAGVWVEPKHLAALARAIIEVAAPEIRRVERERLSATVQHLLSAHAACGVYFLTSLKEGGSHYVEMWLQTQEQHDKWQTALAAVQEAFGVSDESISDSANALKSGQVN